MIYSFVRQIFPGIGAACFSPMCDAGTLIEGEAGLLSTLCQTAWRHGVSRVERKY